MILNTTKCVVCGKFYVSDELEMDNLCGVCIREIKKDGIPLQIGYGEIFGVNGEIKKEKEDQWFLIK